MQSWQIIIGHVVTAFVAVFGAGGLATIYLKHRLDDSSKNSDERKKRRRAVDKAKIYRDENQYRLIELICKKLRGESINGKPINGEIDKAFDDYAEWERKLHDLDLDIVVSDKNK